VKIEIRVLYKCVLARASLLCSFLCSLGVCVICYLLCVNRHCNYTLGIFQSIGFKEFHNYLMLSEAERKNDVGQKLLLEGESCSEMKLLTIC